MKLLFKQLQEAKDNMKKHLLCLITTILIAASLNAQPNYNYEKLQRENLGRGVVAIRKDASTVTDLSLAYSPGVAEPCLEIEKNPQDAYKYTYLRGCTRILPARYELCKCFYRRCHIQPVQYPFISFRLYGRAYGSIPVRSRHSLGIRCFRQLFRKKSL